MWRKRLTQRLLRRELMLSVPKTVIFWVQSQGDKGQIPVTR